MFGDVSDPQLVGTEAMELAVDEVARGDDTAQTFHLGRFGKTGHARVVHQDRHEAFTDRQSHREGEFSVDAS